MSPGWGVGYIPTSRELAHERYRVRAYHFRKNKKRSELISKDELMRVLANPNALSYSLYHIHNTSTTALDLFYHHLWALKKGELAQVFAAIPTTLDTLNLEYCDLYKIETEELTRSLAAIPNTITTLDVSWNQLYQLKERKLKQVLSAIPPTVTTFKFDLDEPNILQILAALPATITSYDLSGKHSYYMHAEEERNEKFQRLIRMLKTLPRTVTTLHLDQNTFPTESQLAQVLAAVPAWVTSLNLGFKRDRQRPSYFSWDSATLVKSFNAITAKITKLYLDPEGTLIGFRKIEEWYRVYTAIPSSVTELDDGFFPIQRDYNNNGNISLLVGAEDCIKKFPAKVNTLRLSRRFLSWEIKDRYDILLSTPATVTTLSLNGYVLFPEYRENQKVSLPSVLAVMPHITCLELRGDFLFGKSEIKIRQAFARIPANITTIRLNKNALRTLNNNQINTLVTILLETGKVIHAEKFFMKLLCQRVLFPLAQRIKDPYSQFRKYFGTKLNSAATQHPLSDLKMLDLIGQFISPLPITDYNTLYPGNTFSKAIESSIKDKRLFDLALHEIKKRISRLRFLAKKPLTFGANKTADVIEKALAVSLDTQKSSAPQSITTLLDYSKTEKEISLRHAFGAHHHGVFSFWRGPSKRVQTMMEFEKQQIHAFK